MANKIVYKNSNNDWFIDNTIAADTRKIDSILELLNTPSTTPAEELRSAPFGSLSYSVGGIAVSSVKQGDIVIVSASFSEPMADSPIVQIAGDGVTEISLTNMTKVSTTSYTYSWTVGSGDGTQVFELATGTDLEGNVITSIPSSGDSVTVDNTRPTALISSEPLKVAA